MQQQYAEQFSLHDTAIPSTRHLSFYEEALMKLLSYSVHTLSHTKISCQIFKYIIQALTDQATW